MTDAKLKTVRRFVAWIFLKLVGSALAVFTLVRVVIPGLVNTHDDALSALGLLSAIAAPVIVGWAAVSIFISTRRFIGEFEEKA